MMFFFRNSLSDQWLMIKAFGLVCFVRLGLWLLPYRTMKEMVARSTLRVSSAPQPQDSKVVKKVGSIVRRASHYVPAASCLTQALATQVLLARRGQISILRIGVIKDEKGELLAHAWVISNGRIIIGLRADLRNYTVLGQMEEVSL